MSQNGSALKGEELKIVVVGDGGCGKTCLLLVYSKGEFPSEYRPSVFDKHVTTISFKGKDIHLNLYDTAGQEDYDRLRPLSYQDADLIIICFDVTNPTSFDNVIIKWHLEVKHFCPDTPIILIGCKTDLRKDKEATRKLKNMNLAPITYVQGEEAGRDMKAHLYLECSAKHKENVDTVFREATQIAMAFRKKQQRCRRKKICAVL